MSDVTLPANLRPTKPLWRNVSFQLTWSSTAASGFGDRMIELAALPMLGVLAHDAQTSAITAAIYFWFFLPYIFISPIGGWLADTLPRKWIMLACDEGRAVILLLAMFMVPAGMMATNIPRSEDWKVYFVLFCVGALAAVFSPTRNAMIPQIVAVKQLNPANSIIMSIGVIASIIGMVIGGWILDQYSLRTGIFIGLACYAVTGMFWAFVRPQPHTGLDLDRELGQWQRFLCAVRYIRQHRPVLRLVLLNALLWSIAMVVAPTIAALCKHSYNITEQFIWWFSVMSAMLGAGMLLGATWVAWINIRRESDLVILLCLVLTGIGLAGLAINKSYYVGMALTLLIGFAGGAAIIMVSTMTQAIVPNFILGRVGGAREVLGNFVAVGVNLMIWQLPVVRKVHTALPDADIILIYSLYGIALMMILVAAWGFRRRILSGPLPSAAANMFWRLCRSYVFVWHRLRLIGRHNVPPRGPVILAANHTTGLDPLIMQAGCIRMVRWIMINTYRFRAAEFLWRTIDPICLEPEAGNLGQIRQVINTLKNDQIVGLFPEGSLQRERRELQPFQPGIGMIAKRSGAMIVPVWIAGTPQTKRMIWHLLRPSHSTVIYGKPYKPDENWSSEQLLDDLRQRMLELAKAV